VILLPSVVNAEEPGESASPIPTAMPPEPRYVYEKDVITKSCTLVRLESGVDVESITVPVDYEGYTVTKIASDAFSSVTGLKEVILLGNPEFLEAEGVNLFLNPTDITFYYYAGSSAEATFRNIGGKLVPISNVIGLTAKKGSDLQSMNLTWQAYPNASGYRIMIKKKNVFVLFAYTLKTSINVPGLKAGEKHEFSVYADIETITGKVLNTKQSLPAGDILRPEGIKKFKAKSLSGKIKLTWKMRKGINGYQVQRKVHVRIKLKGFKPRFSHLKTIKGARKTSMTNIMLVSGMKYSYRIRTYKNVKGKKIFSEWKTINKKKCR
jgi:hypothetical protein